MKSLVAFRRRHPSDSNVAKLFECVSEVVLIDRDGHHLNYEGGTGLLASAILLRGQVACSDVDVPEVMSPRSVAQSSNTRWVEEGASATSVVAPATAEFMMAAAQTATSPVAPNSPRGSRCSQTSEKGERISTHFPTNVAVSIRGARAFKEAMVLVTKARKSLLMSTDKFLAVHPTVKFLRSVRDSLYTLAALYPLFLAPLTRFACEMELLEALLAAEFKASRLNGVGAFSELVRADRLLDAFFVRSRFIGNCSAQTDIDMSVATSDSRDECSWDSLLVPPHSTEPQQARKAECNRMSSQRKRSTSLISATSVASKNALKRVASDLSAASVRSERSALVDSPSEPVQGYDGGVYTGLEQRYLTIRAHCAKKLWFLCGVGFSSATNIGRRQILDGQAVHGGSCNADAVGSSQSADVDSAGPQQSCQTGIVTRCVYSKDLTRLVNLPNVTFAGVFANAKQLPRIQVECRHAGSAGLGTPFHDSAWLCPVQPRSGSTHFKRAVASAPTAPCVGASAAPSKAGVTEGGGECEWWALHFMVNPSLGETTAQLGAQATAGQQESRSTVSGLKALEEWRHQPEVKLLRMALLQACQKRHATSQVSTCRSSAGQLADDLFDRSVDVPTEPSTLASDTLSEGCKCLVLPLDLGWFPSPLFVAVMMKDISRSRTGSAAVASPSVQSAGFITGISASSVDAGVSSVASDRSQTCVPRGHDFFSHLKNMWRRSFTTVAEGAVCERREEQDPTVEVERLLWRVASLVSGRDLRGNIP
eukprot:TRINITY_DN16482_c0_g1_i1.p1 TRINITY_DN16482_c0_g1~~TRINITY_DN16482_c0_g1_i1.p1  ORF type:complete len:842 (+),score=101.03 TRINITY_DN16482_c0_g1_i1:235-2526(+)